MNAAKILVFCTSLDLRLIRIMLHPFLMEYSLTNSTETKQSNEMRFCITRQTKNSIDCHSQEKPKNAWGLNIIQYFRWDPRTEYKY